MITTRNTRAELIRSKAPFKMVTTAKINVVPKIVKPPVKEGKKPFVSTHIMDPGKQARMEKYANVLEEKRAFKKQQETAKRKEIEERMAKARVAKRKK